MITTTITTNRTKFIRSLFQYLSQKDYLWLKAILSSPEHTGPDSDIDLFVKKQDVKDIVKYITSYRLVNNYYIVDKGSVFFLHLTFSDHTHLKLDLLTSLVRKQWLYLEEFRLFNNRIWRGDIATYTTEVLLEHVLLFNILNYSGMPEKYIRYFGKMPKPMQMKLIQNFNKKYNTAFTSFEEMATYNGSDRNHIIHALKRMPGNNLIKRTKRFLGYLKQRFVSINGPTNSVITFSGVDGAGKTTILNDLKKVLTSHYHKKVVVLRHRPSLLPILSAWTKGKKAAEEKAANELPRQGTNRSRISSMLRFAYYFTDFILGRFYIYLRYTLPGYTIIYDRYYFDFIVDSKRSNINLGEALPKWLYRFIMKPDVNIFLYADPEVILRRKKELPPKDIADMTTRYKSVFRDFSKRYQGRYLCIENTDRKATLQTILGSMGLLPKTIAA